ncbi:MAG: hypothetical protein OEN01_00340 [Candidatus Krumholzibacteria bacterium]|nr:hypothetical protein [Candidatus Krumholzibacteria bacterium]
MTKKRKKKTERAEKKTAPRGPALVSASPLASNLRRNQQVLISVFLLIASICVLYPDLVFQDKILAAADAESATSLAAPIQKGMSEGEYPLWNPLLFAGMPSYASLSFNPYVYPVSLLTGFLSNHLKFPAYTWLLLHIFMLGLGVWLLLVERRVHFLIAAGAGIIMMWMPNHVAVGVHGHGSQASAVGFIPFVLFFWDRLWRGKGIVINASVLVILLGFQLLRAHIQISYYTFGLLGLHLVFFGFLRIRDTFRRQADGVSQLIFRFLYRPGGAISMRQAAILDVVGAAVILAVVVLGSLGVSAVLLAPVHDYSGYSIRGAAGGGGLDYDYATMWSLHPLECLTFVIPFAFGFGKFFYYGYMPFTDYPNYVGIVVVVFAVIGLFIVRKRFCWFLLFVIVFSTLVAFGNHMPVLYNLLFKFLPYFNKFRVPVMFLIVQQIAFVLLFAMGLSAILSYDAVRGRRAAKWAVGASAAVLLIVLFTHDYWTGGFASSIAGRIRNVRSVQEQVAVANLAGDLLFKDLLKFSVLLIGMSALALLFFRRHINARVYVMLVLVAALVDVFLVDRHILHPERLYRVQQLQIIRDRPDAERFTQSDPLVEYLQSRPGRYRIFPMTHPSSARYGEFESNRYMNFGIPSIGGYHPAKLAIYEQFLNAMADAVKRGNLQMVNILNARYLVTPNQIKESAALKPVWRGGDYKGQEKFVYENLQSLPRVFFVDQFEVLTDNTAIDRMITDESLDLSQTVLLESVPQIAPVSAEGASAEITKYGFNEIHIDASLPAPALLVVSEIYYPRWRVWVNGEPGEIIRANHVLRAVALGAGDNELVFRYDRSLFKKSLILSVVTLSAALFTLAVALTARRWGKAKWKLSS